MFIFLSFVLQNAVEVVISEPVRVLVHSNELTRR